MIPPTPDNSTSIVLRRTFTASRQRVFRAWIEPEALEQWLQPGGQKLTVRSLEARVGGSFCFEIEDGSCIVGTYLHIMPPEKLVFTWAGKVTQDKDTLVTLDFLDKGPVTEVVLTHEGLSVPELHTLFGSGWQSLFNALAEFLSLHHTF